MARTPRYVYRSLALAALMLLVSCSLQAQRRTRYELGAGMALSFIHVRSNSEASYRPRLLPQAGLAAIIPISDRFSLRTGFAYEQKGWHSSATQTDSSNVRTLWRSKLTLHALTIPLAIHYTILARGNLEYSLAGGMSYSFFLSGRHQTTQDRYLNDQLLSSSEASGQPYIALIPDNDKMELSYDRSAYFMFCPAARLEATVLYNRRFLLQAFGAYGLSELSTAVSDAPVLQLHYCGLSLGIAIPGAVGKRAATPAL